MSAKKKAWVEHAFYGCDTGCCGSVIIVDGEWAPRTFDFMHDRDGIEQAARDWAAENDAEIDEELLAEGVEAVRACWWPTPGARGSREGVPSPLGLPRLQVRASGVLHGLPMPVLRLRRLRRDDEPARLEAMERQARRGRLGRGGAVSKYRQWVRRLWQCCRRCYRMKWPDRFELCRDCRDEDRLAERRDGKRVSALERGEP